MCVRQLFQGTAPIYRVISQSFLISSVFYSLVESSFCPFVLHVFFIGISILHQVIMFSEELLGIIDATLPVVINGLVRFSIFDLHLLPLHQVSIIHLLFQGLTKMASVSFLLSWSAIECFRPGRMIPSMLSFLHE